MNSLYPMLGTGVTAVLGFVFWVFVARLFPESEVGLAGTLIALYTMLSTLALVGFETSAVRFLARDSRKNESITTGMCVVALAGTAIALVVAVALPFFNSPLAHMLNTPATTLAFIVFTVSMAVSLYTDALFLALRRTHFTLVKNTILSTVKIGLPFLFVPWGAFGIFAAAALAQAVGLVYGLFVLARHFGYHPTGALNMAVVRKVWRYSAGNYMADIMHLLPLTLLPLIVVQTLGAEQAAYYYIVMMIASLLYVIPASAMRALFAEGAFDEAHTKRHIRHALMVTLGLLTPAALILLAVGPYLLAVFGNGYARAGYPFLVLMTMASLAVTLFTLYGSLFRIKKDIGGLIIRNAVYVVATFAVLAFTLPFGLTGVGVAYMVGMLVGALTGALLYHTPSIVNAHQKPRTLLGKFHPHHIYYILWHELHERILWPIATWREAKQYYRAYRRTHPSEPPRTILFYPDLPKTYHIMYKLCHRMGWKITNNISAKADVRMFFRDKTVREVPHELRALHEGTRVINIASTDISKTRVEQVFRDTFGYGMAIDPTTHEGQAVRKSDENAVHDGTIVTCPCEPEPGYIYQRYIDTTVPDGRHKDLRIPIFDDFIPCVLTRYKDEHDHFNVTTDVDYHKTEDALSPEEIACVRSFVRSMGLDYAEIDALRDGGDGKLYIVDANNTPAGPIGPLYKHPEDMARWYDALEEGMRRFVAE